MTFTKFLVKLYIFYCKNCIAFSDIFRYNIDISLRRVFKMNFIIIFDAGTVADVLAAEWRLI